MGGENAHEGEGQSESDLLCVSTVLNYLGIYTIQPRRQSEEDRGTSEGPDSGEVERRWLYVDEGQKVDRGNQPMSRCSVLRLGGAAEMELRN